MSTDLSPAPAPSPEAAEDQPSRVARFARFMATHPHLVLGIVLFVLILITGWVEPNYLSVAGLRNSALFAVPIGIMAA